MHLLTLYLYGNHGKESGLVVFPLLFAYLVIPRMTPTATRSDEELHPWNKSVVLGSMDGFGTFLLYDSVVSRIWVLSLGRVSYI